MINTAKIRKYLEVKRLTVNEFAKKIELSEQGVYNLLKTGKVRANTMMKICEVMGITANELYENRPNKDYNAHDLQNSSIIEEHKVQYSKGNESEIIHIYKIITQLQQEIRDLERKVNDLYRK